MTPVALMREAAVDGVTLLLSSTGTVKVNGDEVAVNRWLALIQENKAAIVDALAVGLMSAEQEVSIRAWITQVDGRDLELIADIIERCHANADTLAYFLSRSEEVSKLSDDASDDRRTCHQCSNLTPRGRCQAAQRGEINRTSRFEPMIDKPQRCVGYAPGADDPDRRRGSERWPGLLLKQEGNRK